MSERNVELAYEAVDAFNRRDLEAFVALNGPEVEFATRAEQLEGGGPSHGHDELRAWWQGLLEVSPDFRAEIDEVRDLGDLTIVRQQHRGSGATSGAPMLATAWILTQWRDGKAVWWRVVLTEAEALEAAGERRRLISQANLTSLRQAFADFNDRDFDAASALLAEDATWEPFLSQAETRLPLRGRERIRTAWESQVELMDLRFEPEEFIAVGPTKIVVPVRALTRGRESEMQLAASITWLYTMVDGVAESVEGFETREQALEAAGQE